MAKCAVDSCTKPAKKQAGQGLQFCASHLFALSGGLRAHLLAALRSGDKGAIGVCVKQGREEIAARDTAKRAKGAS